MTRFNYSLNGASHFADTTNGDGDLGNRQIPSPQNRRINAMALQSFFTQASQALSAHTVMGDPPMHRTGPGVRPAMPFRLGAVMDGQRNDPPMHRTGPGVDGQIMPHRDPAMHRTGPGVGRQAPPSDPAMHRTGPGNNPSAIVTLPPPHISGR